MSILNFFKRNNNKNSNFSAKDVENLFIKAIEENYVDEAMQDVMQKRMEHYIDRAAKALEGKG